MKLPSNHTHEILEFFDSSHLREDLRGIAKPIEDIAHEYARNLSGTELDVGLRKLLEAKDCFVRAAIAEDRSLQTLTRADVPAP